MKISTQFVARQRRLFLRQLCVEPLEDRVNPSVTSVFELDANVDKQTTHDWDQVFADRQTIPPGTTSGAVAASFLTDPVGSNGDDSFTGGSSKDTQGIQQSPWLTLNSKPQSKSDISHAYAAAYTDPSNGHLLLYAGLDRYDNNGNSGVGFWFLRNQISPNSNATTHSNRFVGEHADGDILIATDFTREGTPAVQIYRWSGNDATGRLLVTTPVAGTAFATVNRSSISVPWSYVNKSGDNKPAPGAFVEVGVDLTALGLQSCFSTFLAETRSSHSLIATLSDFVVGSFASCSITAPPFTGLATVGQNVTYPLTVQNTGGVTVFIQNVTDTLLGDIVLDGVVQAPVSPVTSIDASALNPDGSLAPGESVTIFVDRTVQASDPDPTLNTVTFVYNLAADFSSTEVTTSVIDTVNLFQPSAELTVTATPDTALHLGDPIVYTFTVSNTSSADSPSLALGTASDNFTDTLLGDLEVQALDAIDALDGIADGDTTLAPGESITFNVTRIILAGDPSPLVNSATVSFSLAQNLGTFSNTTTAAYAATVTLRPHLVIEKSVTDGIEVVHPGDWTSYTISVSNDGAGPAPNVLVTDQLPEPDLLSWTVESSTFDAASMSGTGFLTAYYGSLPAGAATVVTVRAPVPLDIFGLSNGVGNGDPLPSSLFELDGNALDDGATGDDWSNVAVGDGGQSIAHAFVTDTVNSVTDDIFAGGGSKDTLGIQQGPWLYTGTKPQAKNDISNAYVAMYVDPNTDDRVLYAGLDRFDNSGDATVGLWLLRNQIGLGTKNPGTDIGPFTGTHADGDILLVSDFTQGGSTSSVSVFRWTGDDSSGSLVPVTVPSGTTFAIVNGGSITVPWSYADKSHNTAPAAGEFLEMGVNLNALGLEGCFSSFLTETRSSTSPTATLSDFVIGNFNTCRIELPNTAGVQADGLDSIDSNSVLITVLGEPFVFPPSASISVVDSTGRGSIPLWRGDVLGGFLAGSKNSQPTPDAVSTATRDQNEHSPLDVANVDQVFGTGEENGHGFGIAGDLDDILTNNLRTLD